MKIITIYLLLFSLSTSLTYAQNKVEVSQKGEGNTVSISQSSSSDEHSDRHCKENQQFNNTKSNAVQISAADGSSLLLSKNSVKNNLEVTLLDLYKIESLQNGTQNTLFVTLPDSASPAHLNALQEGSENTIAVRSADSPSSVSVTQQGKANRVSVNPCSKK